MAKCSKCGAEVEDDVKICPVCGAPIEEPEAPAAPEAPEAPETEETKESFKEKVAGAAAAVKEKANQIADEVKTQADESKAAEAAALAEEYDPEDIKKNKVMAILAYFGILFLIPLLAAKDSKFARFHTNQGIVLFICELICAALASIHVTLIQVCVWIIDVILFVFCIIGIINAAKGKVKELPVIGKFNILK